MLQSQLQNFFAHLLERSWPRVSASSSAAPTTTPTTMSDGDAAAGHSCNFPTVVRKIVSSFVVAREITTHGISAPIPAACNSGAKFGVAIARHVDYVSGVREPRAAHL